MASFFRFLSTPTQLEKLYRDLKELVSNPTLDIWFAIADEIHIAYDPGDPAAVECISYLIMKEHTEGIGNHLEDWIKIEKQKFYKNANHLYLATTLADYEQLVLSGMPDNPVVRDYLESFESVNAPIFVDSRLDRIECDIANAARDYAQSIDKAEINYFFTFPWGIPGLSYAIGIVLICFGAFWLYKDFGYYQWAVHTLEEYPYISRDYMNSWNESCMWGGSYVLCGLLDIFYPLALKYSGNSTLWSSAKIFKYINIIAVIIMIILLVGIGADFFWVFRPLD